MVTRPLRLMYFSTTTHIAGRADARLTEGQPDTMEVFGGEISKGKNSGSIILSGSADLAEAVGVLEIVGKSGDIERRALAVVFANEVGDFDREVVV
ncbi:MAG: hypothetical protein AB8B85_19725, partial [Paracoccaceae bacterium]